MNQKQEILFFGSNKTTKFYNKKIQKITKPTQIYLENENENENENEKQIKQISSSYFSTIFLFKNGKAIEYLKKSKKNPQKIQIENIQIENIQKKEMYLPKGKNINPKNPKQFINISSLIEDTNDRIIKDIVSGSQSIYLLTSNQNAYGIGSNYFGQLGSKTIQKTQKPILMMKNVSKIFSGIYSSSVFLLNSNQELFGCGSNYWGQLGLGNEGYFQERLTQNPKYSKRQNN
ncbi:claret isoform a [Anaeramoeba ignava]|uniref:Claret isoform a n=1 Tax=Anaeramoeba ignava TaxID=1746090 RepID=A0A9Q0RGI3_ANAIG|nr:claret isoform a [Anaeramoeba ignava]